ncbi:unnamed protein product [Mytilus coruscus]|uniref:Uncharacterized protein n=1 Tax=Mytilus coruscus TaxID=42192 RepID=A0A6J8CK38_MYTCO|nr:unnamed protein product [Mytilus coruscus]
MAAPNAAEDTCSLQKYFGGTCDHAKDYSLKDCNKTITGHLWYCKLGNNDILDEAELLCKRAGIWNWSSKTVRGATICPTHRHLYGIGWKPGLKCGFPGHPQSSKEGKPQRGITKGVRASSAKMGLPMQIGHRQCLDEVSNTCTSESNPGIDLSNNLQEDILKFDEANNMSNDRSEKSDIRVLILKNTVTVNHRLEKSYCDSKIAHMRTKMKTFVASGKDVITAKDMKVAIDDGSGVVGCQVAYVTVDSTKQTLTSHKWKGVNAYTDIKYEENGIRVYRAHGIGTGSFLSHAEINKLTSSLQ